MGFGLAEVQNHSKIIGFTIILSNEEFEVESFSNLLKTSFDTSDVIFSFFQIPVLLSKEQLLKIIKIINA